MKKILKYSLLLFILLLIPITTVNAKTLGDIERELSASEKKLNDTNVQKAINKQDIDTTNKKISDIKSNIDKINKDISLKEQESVQLGKNIVKKNEEIKDLMRYYQISSSGSTMLEYIMGAKSITDLIYRLSITEQISSYNKKSINEMNDMIAENERIKTELASKKDELANLKNELDTQIVVLNEKQGELDDEGETETQVIKGIKSQISYYKSLGCKSSDNIAVCTRKVYGNTDLPVGTTFRRPTASGRITSEFGNRTLNGSFNKHFAIDIGMPIGTSVYSIAPGIVGYTGDICGTSLVVWHNINGKEYSSIYCHLSKQLVKKGQIVTADTKIALSGCTGKCFGAHLHLGLATGKYKALDGYSRYYSVGKGDSLEEHTFNPRNVIIFPSKGSSYSNR